MKRDFNLAAKLLLGYSMFAMIANIVSNITNMSINNYLGKSNLFPSVEIALCVLIVVAEICTFIKLRPALIALTTLFVVRFAITILWNSPLTLAYNIGLNLPYFIRDFGLFAIAMCFKKNGVSGWRSMLASKEYLESHIQTANRAEVD